MARMKTSSSRGTNALTNTHAVVAVVAIWVAAAAALAAAVPTNQRKLLQGAQQQHDGEPLFHGGQYNQAGRVPGQNYPRKGSVVAAAGDPYQGKGICALPTKLASNKQQLACAQAVQDSNCATCNKGLTRCTSCVGSPAGSNERYTLTDGVCALVLDFESAVPPFAGIGVRLNDGMFACLNFSTLLLDTDTGAIKPDYTDYPFIMNVTAEAEFNSDKLLGALSSGNNAMEVLFFDTWPGRYLSIKAPAATQRTFRPVSMSLFYVAGFDAPEIPVALNCLFTGWQGGKEVVRYVPSEQLLDTTRLHVVLPPQFSNLEELQIRIVPSGEFANYETAPLTFYIDDLAVAGV